MKCFGDDFEGFGAANPLIGVAQFLDGGTFPIDHTGYSVVIETCAALQTPQ